MSGPDSLTAVLAALLVASAVVPAVSVATMPESAVTTHQSNGSKSLACGFAAGSTTSDGDAERNVSITTWVAPGAAYDELKNASAIEAATDAGQVTPLDDDEPTVATTDIAVHRIELNGSALGFLDRLAAQDRRSPTENFRHLVQQGGIEFRYIGPSACPPRLALNETVERGALRVVPDREDGTLYVLLDVDEAVYQRPGSPSGTDDWDWGRHAMSVELERSSGLVAESVTAESQYDAEDPEATFAAETEGLVRASAESNQTVRGHTTVAPGTEIRVQLRPVEAPTGKPNATTTVNRSRGFDARFDLSGVGDALYTVRVLGMERDEDFRRTTLVAVGNATGAAIYAGTPESEGLTLDDLSVATTHGGFAVVRNASGGIVGVSEYLDPGSASPKPDLRPPIRSNQTVTVTLYRDANGNRTFDATDEPYRANGWVVSDATNVTIEGEPPDVPTTRTTTLETPRTRTATATTSTPATETNVFTDTTTTTAASSTVPGFSPVIAVVALAGSLAVLRWRR